MFRIYKSLYIVLFDNVFVNDDMVAVSNLDVLNDIDTFAIN